MSSATEKNKIPAQPGMWYLVVHLCAFIFLWFAAWHWISYIDAMLLSIILIFLYLGVVRGGIKTFFGFFGILASLLLPLNLYLALSKVLYMKGLPTLWVELFSFVFLVVFCFTCCYFLSSYLQKKVEKARILQGMNRFFGFPIGGMQGFVIAYFCITAMLIARMDLQYEKQFQTSYGAKIIHFLENRYHIFDNLAKMELARKMEWKKENPK